VAGPLTLVRNEVPFRKSYPKLCTSLRTHQQTLAQKFLYSHMSMLWSQSQVKFTQRSVIFAQYKQAASAC